MHLLLRLKGSSLTAGILSSVRRLARNSGQSQEEVDVEVFRTGNSGTRLRFDCSWRVVDIGSGHNPHPRADVLVDRFLAEHRERAGRPLSTDFEKALVIADASALPFRDDAFDFSIASHLAEHLDRPSEFASEIQRIAKAGYIETPSRWTERLRHLPMHKWYVVPRDGELQFIAVTRTHPMGPFGKFIVSLYFYDAPQAKYTDVYQFMLGNRRPLHPLLVVVRKSMMAFVKIFRPLTYTRFTWAGSFDVEVSSRVGDSEKRGSLPKSSPVQEDR